MNTVKAYLCILLFGGLGIFVLSGGSPPKDPECYSRCFTDTLAHLIEDIGHLPASLILFFCAISSFVYWQARVR